MLSKSQESSENCFSPVFFTQSARTAWRHILQYFNVKSPHKILLPPYIGITEREGSGIFDPVDETQTPFDFYQLDDRLSVDLVSLEMMLAEGQYKILLLAHYFGFCRTDLRHLRLLCDQYDVILVEDCAHALSLHSQKSNLGAVGDFTVYSLHKFLPLEKGGLLRVNNFSLVMGAPDPSDLLEPELVQKFVGFNLNDIVNRRLQNYRLLYSMLADHNGIEIMYNLLEGDVPHDFPVLVKKGHREKLYFLLMELGIPTTALYYRLIDAIKTQGFAGMQEISYNILNLPIHQDIDKADLELMAERIKWALDNLNQ